MCSSFFLNIHKVNHSSLVPNSVIGSLADNISQGKSHIFSDDASVLRSIHGLVCTRVAVQPFIFAVLLLR